MGKESIQQKRLRIRPARVNLTYQVEDGGAMKIKELPFVVGVLADLGGKNKSAKDPKFVTIDRDNFNDVMRSMKLTTTFSAPNTLSGKEGEEMPVKLKFETLKDMEPEAVAKQVPELQKLLDLRDALTALKGPLGNLPEFRKKIQSLVTDPAAKEKLLKELGGAEEKK